MKADELLAEFSEASGQLRSYILRLTASVADTEDIVHDTYIKATEKIDTFRGQSSLKTWLFAIASNLAKDNLRARRRWVENVTDIAREAALSNPNSSRKPCISALYPRRGNLKLMNISPCFTCISKSLPLEQQLCVLLKEVYEFKVNEISDIVDCSEAMVKYYLHAGRSKMIDIFEGRCALVNKNGICHQCSELNGIYNPKQKFQEEVVKIEMARQASNSEKEHLFDLRLKIVQGIDPFASNAAELQLHHLEHNRQVMENYLKKDAG